MGGIIGKGGTTFGKGGLFNPDRPKTVKPTPPAPIPPVPVVDEQVEDIARRNRPRGRRETFLTGELIPETGKRRRLG